MDPTVSLKKEWTLTQQAFDRLLDMLDADHEQAGQKYERIRLKLVKYFEWHGAELPDKEADETINRVARKIDEGAEIQNLNAYFYGVARLVFAESLRAREKQEEAFRQLSTVELPEDQNVEAAQRQECFDLCLRRLPEENRSLILEYYQDEKSDKIKRRKHLAARLGIPLNALRIRAHRIRLGMETCVSRCMGQNA